MSPRNVNDHSSRQLSVHKALTCLEGKSAWVFAHSLFGEMSEPCRNNKSKYTSADLMKCCTCAGNGDVIQSRQRVSLEHCLLFCCCFGLQDQLWISWGMPSSVSRSWAFVACVVCPTVVSLAVVVGVTGVVGRIRCFSLLLTKSPSMETISSRLAVEPSRVVREIVFPFLGWSSLLPATFLLG